MEDKSKRLAEAIDFLKQQNAVSTLEDVAAKVDRSKNNISSAINGDKRYLSDKFLRHFNASFGNIFNIEWLTRGIGSMLCPTETKDINKFFIEMYKEDEKTKKLIDDSMARIKEQLEFQKEQAQFYKELVEELKGQVAFYKDKASTLELKLNDKP